MRRGFFTSMVFCCFFVTQAEATIYQAVNSGAWSDPTNWDLNLVPNKTTDTVIIDGHELKLSGTDNFQCAALELKNSSGKIATLTIDNDALLTINGDAFFLAEDKNKDLVVYTIENGQLLILGDLDIIRSTEIDLPKKDCSLVLVENSSITVRGNMLFDYQGAASSANRDEILLSDNSMLTVDGDVSINYSGEKKFTIDARTASRITFGSLYVSSDANDEFKINLEDNTVMQINGDFTLVNNNNNKIKIKTNNASTNIHVTGSLYMESTINGGETFLELTDQTLTTVEGDIIMSAVADQNVGIKLKTASELVLNGSFRRPTGYGYMTMENDTRISMGGSGTKYLSGKKADQISTDSLCITNLTIETGGSDSIILEGNVMVTETMQFTSGRFYTTEENMLIVEDGVTLGPGNINSFVDGPIKKLGSTGGQAFTFPTGDGDKFAPITVSAISNKSSQVTAEYSTDPPPFGTIIDGTLEEIDTTQFWNLIRNEESGDVQVTLHWEEGLDLTNNPADVVVASLDESKDEWTSLGQGTLLGNILGAVSGTVSNLITCPPPFGTMSKFTFGEKAPTVVGGIVSSSARILLPVEFSYFKGERQGEQVLLTWETMMERNSDYFIIEKAIENKYFFEIGRVDAAGESQTATSYSFIDTDLHLGKNCYRLRQVDLDGTEEYTYIIIIPVSSLDAMPVVMTNPVQQNLKLSLGNNPTREAGIQILDANGHVLHNDKYSTGVLVTEIDLHRVGIHDPGLYFIQIEEGPRRCSIPFIKVND